jgi:hypothetical protein
MVAGGVEEEWEKGEGHEEDDTFYMNLYPHFCLSPNTSVLTHQYQQAFLLPTIMCHMIFFYNSTIWFDLASIVIHIMCNQDIIIEVEGSFQKYIWEV